MSPTEHYKRATTVGWFMLLAAGILIAFAFFSRNADGQFHLVCWAESLDDAGLAQGVAHFLLWGLALAFMGGSFAVGMVVFCRMVPARCPRCGGAARWDSGDTVSYSCRACGHRHDTGIGWGER